MAGKYQFSPINVASAADRTPLGEDEQVSEVGNAGEDVEWRFMGPGSATYITPSSPPIACGLVFVLCSRFCRLPVSVSVRRTDLSTLNNRSRSADGFRNKRQARSGTGSQGRVGKRRTNRAARARACSSEERSRPKRRARAVGSSCEGDRRRCCCGQRSDRQRKFETISENRASSY